MYFWLRSSVAEAHAFSKATGIRTTTAAGKSAHFYPVTLATALTPLCAHAPLSGRRLPSRGCVDRGYASANTLGMDQCTNAQLRSWVSAGHKPGLLGPVHASLASVPACVSIHGLACRCRNHVVRASSSCPMLGTALLCSWFITLGSVLVGRGGGAAYGLTPAGAARQREAGLVAAAPHVASMSASRDKGGHAGWEGPRKLCS
jgi:hypothetical protein